MTEIRLNDEEIINKMATRRAKVNQLPESVTDINLSAFNMDLIATFNENIVLTNDILTNIHLLEDNFLQQVTTAVSELIEMDRAL